MGHAALRGLPATGAHDPSLSVNAGTFIGYAAITRTASRRGICSTLANDTGMHSESVRVMDARAEIAGTHRPRQSINDC